MFPSPGIGDILAICQLVVKIGTIIYDLKTSDLPQEFQELKEELRVLYEVLQSIKNINDTSLSLDATIALQRIQREAKACEDAMNDFLKNNSPPESKTRRAVWMIRVTRKAALLREKLSVHRENLGIFWNEFRHQQQTDMSNRLLTLAAEQSATSNGQTNLLSQLLALVRDQITNSNRHTDALSQLRGITIDQAASLNLWRKELQVLRPVIQGITLVDAVGSRMEIPFLFCRTYDLLSDVLSAIFKSDNRPGRNFVLRGDYNLVHGDAKDLISSPEWISLLKPDLNVEMSMILRRNGAATDICPRCRTSFSGDTSGGWATCIKCCAQFQIKQNIEEIEELVIGSTGDEEITTPAVAALAQKVVSTPSGQSSQPEESPPPEWALFRLLSVVSTVFKLKPQTGIAEGLPPIQHASSQATMQDPSSQPATEFQRSLSTLVTIEDQFRDLLQQAKTALSTGDISTLQSVNERLGENLKTAQEERDKWQQSLSNRAWSLDTIERTVIRIPPLAQRWVDNANKMEQMMKKLDGAIQQLAQQTLQDNRASNGSIPQQQWSDMQNTPRTQTNHMNPANPGLINAVSNANASATTMNPIQQRPSVGGSGQGLLSDQEIIRRNFASILASYNMEPTVFVAGHLVDLYSLFAFGRRILQQSDYNNNQVWRAVGAQLGLPAEGTPLLASAQAGELLQEYYYKVNTIIEATKAGQIQNMPPQPGVTPPNGLNPNLSAQTSVSPGLPGGGTTQQQMSANHTVLQRIKPVYPTVDFANISQHMLANLPAPRFEQLLRDMVAKAQLSAQNNPL